MKRWNDKDDHRTERIADGVYFISEFAISNCYLLIGKERALLIDACNGTGNLRKACEKLTDLPITVALTHFHPDHAGGCPLFDIVYRHPDDDIFFFRKSLARPVRYLMAKLAPFRTAKIGYREMCPNRKTSFLPLKDGQVFDLGGKTVRALCLPGHSLGSTVFLAEEDKLMFTGDNVCPELLMHLPATTSVRQWLDGARQIYVLSAEYTPYAGHDAGPQSRQKIKELIETAEKLVSATAKNTKHWRARSLRTEHGIKIAYRTDKVL